MLYQTLEQISSQTNTKLKCVLLLNKKYSKDFLQPAEQTKTISLCKKILASIMNCFTKKL